jgi:Cell wall-associated hydrolases (invasion-associated proteins)
MALKYEHLVGRPFKFGVTDCYSIVRDFYADNFGIVLPNYARPNDFWEHDLSLYYRLYHKTGFRSLDVHPSEYRPGDVIVMALRAKVGNHAGVLLENGRMLHHVWGNLSTVVPYGGLWRNITVGVFRHKDVVLPEVEETANIREFLPERVRQKIDAAIEDYRAAQGEVRPEG